MDHQLAKPVVGTPRVDHSHFKVVLKGYLPLIIEVDQLLNPLCLKLPSSIEPEYFGKSRL